MIKHDNSLLRRYEQQSSNFPGHASQKFLLKHLKFDNSEILTLLIWINKRLTADNSADYFCFGTTGAVEHTIRALNIAACLLIVSVLHQWLLLIGWQQYLSEFKSNFAEASRHTKLSSIPT